MIRRPIAFCLSFVLILLALCACATSGNVALKATPVSHDEKFGGVYIQITDADFLKLGFEYGDSVDVVFSNGTEMRDLPYYNGYYVDMGQPLLVGYPGYPYIRVGINYGDDLWVIKQLDEQCTATVTLREAAKYLNVQQMNNLEYPEEQEMLSDVVFANFRAANAGNLKKNILYRSASPCNNEHHRAAVTDRLASQAGIRTILNLSETDDEINAFIAAEDFNSPYFLSLYREDAVIALGLSANFRSEEFRTRLASGLTELAQCDGPFLVHCVEGKDRTGYVMMLLEALAGASYDEIIDDYMLTYDNYYQINLDTYEDMYFTIKTRNIDAMLLYVTGVEDIGELKNASLDTYVIRALVSMGMKEEDVNLLKEKLTAG